VLRRACELVPCLSLLPTALVLLLSGCATVPITGRTQLNMISDQQLAAAADQDFSKFASLVVQKNALLSPSESPQAATTTRRLP